MIHLDDYRELHADLGSHAQEVLRAAWSEACRHFSPGGLEAYYLKGASALHTLGRGGDIVASFLDETPALAAEIGEEAVGDLIDAALRCFSKTSTAVVTLLVATSAAAARRLGDRELFQGYLRLVEQLLAQAPRGVRPMLEHLDELLGKLTLGGLRRWALWGAQAHRTDYEAQLRYFSLASADAQAVLQDQRKGTLFVDIQRRLGMYLRALWGRDFFMRPTAGDYEEREGYRPYIEDFVVRLPDAYDDEAGVSGLERYRAAAAHAAAHLAYTRRPLSAEALNPLQMAAIGVIEDARVERLAVREFPGLGELWRRLHTAHARREATLGDHLDRIARALADESYEDAHPLVAKARLLWAARQNELDDNALSWDIGVALAHDLARLGLAFDPRRDVQGASYRDDNRYVWEFAEADFAFASAAAWREKQLRRNVSLMELVNEVEVETAGDDAQEIWVLSSELIDDDGSSFNEREGRQPPPQPHHYPEWDYQMQLDRPNWVTVLENRAPVAEPALVEDILARHKPLVARLKYLIEAMQPQGVTRVRKLEEGDEVDINAAIASLVQIRLGEQPDPRVMMRNLRRTRDLAVLLLVDLSESTNEKVRRSDETVLGLSRAACALLAEALQRIGDPFAIHGFASDGRHDVQYYRIKDFGEDYDETARARLAGMRGSLSTRMGAAVRHAGSFLRRQPQGKRLLLLLTDGEPADVDVADPQYLRHDCRKAVERLRSEGVASFCLSLDPHADAYVSRIFGAGGYRVLDAVQRLPEVLPTLYMGLTK